MNHEQEKWIVTLWVLLRVRELPVEFLCRYDVGLSAAKRCRQ